MSKVPTLDLHGVTSEEVLDLVDAFLMKQGERKGVNEVRIMTGKGKGILKKIVLDYLKKGNFPWKYEQTKSGESNEGVISVFLG